MLAATYFLQDRTRYRPILMLRKLFKPNLFCGVLISRFYRGQCFKTSPRFPVFDVFNLKYIFSLRLTFIVSPPHLFIVTVTKLYASRSLEDSPVSIHQ